MDDDPEDMGNIRRRNSQTAKSRMVRSGYRDWFMPDLDLTS